MERNTKQIAERSGISHALVAAVIKQTGRENLEDIARHGVDGGFAGFTYYTDTVPFFRRNRAAIVALVNGMAEEFGQEPMALVAGFRCLEPADDETRASIGRCLYGGRVGDADTQVANALAWFAAEEVARAANPEV